MGRGIAQAKTSMIEAAVEILRKSNPPLTARRMFYKLVSAGVIENTLHTHHRLMAALREA
jgi:hypothetical protein